MTDEDTSETATDRTEAVTASDAAPDDERGPSNGSDGGAIDADEERSPMAYLYWGAFAVLLLLALVAVVRFYMSASRAISIWIAPDFEPIVQSAFNLAVLFACALGLSVLVRRMRD
jgi:uncharacterized membrane protein